MGVSPVFLHLKGEQIMAKSKKEKKYFYVGVQTDKGMQFVTKDDYSTRTSYWEPSEKPMAMSHDMANDIALGLSWNGYAAVVVESFYELTEHFIAAAEKKEET